MKYFNNFDIPLLKDTAFTIGKFDGFHLGHRKLIEGLKDYAELHELTSVVLSFYPPPSEVITGKMGEVIFTQEEKREILESMGIDIFIEYPFTKDFAHIDPVRFVEDILFKKLKCRYLAVGSDYRFGKDRSGSGEMLKSLSKSNGVQLDIIGDIMFNEEKISSTIIKKNILQNDFNNVTMLIRMPYYIKGYVVGGKKIGRTIGFPTANIIPDKRKLLPKDGVYITQTHHNGKVYKSITNIGLNPTVAGASRTVETYMLGLDYEVYGDEIKVEFLEWVREPVRFDSVMELQKQICKDIMRLRGVY